MAKILITGANGQVGDCLTRQLKTAHHVLAVGRDALDITNREMVLQTVQDFQPEIIINAAAYTAVDKAEEETVLAEEINALGAQYLAQAAANIGSAILHISTDYVFDGKSKMPYKESDVTNPQGVYGASKLAGEQAVQSANAKHVILRTAWVFGEHGNNFVKTMLRLGKTRDALSIVGDQMGAPTYAGDIAKVLIKISEKILAGEEMKYGIYHFSGMPYVSWFEFAEEIFTQAVHQGILANSPKLAKITTAEYPTPAKRPANSCLDLSKIKQTFDIEPSDWRKAIKNIQAYA